jgi:hypothetical protein
MNDLPQGQFNQMLSTYGSQLCEEQQRCEALLRDTFPEYPRQVSLLVNALKQGIPQELLSSHNKIPFEVTRSRLVRKLADEMFVQDQAAQWVVDSWSEALGVGAATRPGTVMQAPDVSSGNPERRSQGTAPPGTAPTVMHPAEPENLGGAGGNVSPFAGMGNSGNYNNPANYNPPVNPPDYGIPGNYGTPVNTYGNGTAVVRPNSSSPQVWVWFCVYCGAMVVWCIIGLLVGIGVIAADNGNTVNGVFRLMTSGIGLLLFAAAPFLPKARWAWIYDIVMICLGMMSCCLPASIALLVFWIRPEVKAFFNMAAE